MAELRIRETPRAIEDLDGIEDYLAERDIEAAKRVISAVHSTYESLLAWPEMGVVLPYKGVRMRLVKGFPQFLVLYQIEPPFITVVRVIRGAQDWTRLLSDVE